MDLPVYLLDIDENGDTEVNYVALVDRPAIKLGWQKFQDFVIEPNEGETQDEFIGRCISFEVGNGIEQDQAAAICYSKWQKKSEMKFEADDEKRIVTGPLMIADMPIYRKEEGEEFYAVFTADSIEKIAQKFFTKGYQSNVNLMHDGQMIVEGATMFESWIVDRSLNKLPMKGYEEVADGSWFGSFKVNNDEVWNMIKENVFKGFSVEGLFTYRKQQKTEEQVLSEIQKLLSQISI